MNENLMGRLLNWKFQSAIEYIEDEPYDVQILVSSLQKTFGNSGWFSGEMGTIVEFALRSIGVGDDEEGEDEETS